MESNARITTIDPQAATARAVSRALAVAQIGYRRTLALEKMQVIGSIQRDLHSLSLPTLKVLAHTVEQLVQP
jgi:hypothetical protein